MAKKSVAWLQQPVCGNCRHFSRLDDTDQIPSEDLLGECLRYPPTVIGINEDDQVEQGLPIVEARHKCGEHGGVIN
jgi:hypothetical protein